MRRLTFSTTSRNTSFFLYLEVKMVSKKSAEVLLGKMFGRHYGDHNASCPLLKAADITWQRAL